MNLNNLLQLKGTFYDQKNKSSFGPPNLPKDKFVSSEHMKNLVQQLQRIQKFWEENRDIDGALVSVYYIHVIAKSNRIQAMLSEKSRSPNFSIRGSKFGFIKDENGQQIRNHIFTHYVKLGTIDNTIHNLKKVFQIVERDYNGKITHEDIGKINRQIINMNTSLKEPYLLN